MMEILRKCLTDQRLLFLIVGGVNTVFSTVLFIVLVLLIGRRVPSAVCLSISWTISLILAFFAYRLFVFRVKGSLLLDFLRYAGTNLTALVVNMALLTIFVDVMRWPAIPVQIAIACIVVTFTYFGHKHVSFRRS